MNPRTSDRAVCAHEWEAPKQQHGGKTTRVTQRCTLMKGHDGDHRSPANATAPNRAKATA